MMFNFQVLEINRFQVIRSKVLGSGFKGSRVFVLEFIHL